MKLLRETSVTKLTILFFLFSFDILKPCLAVQLICRNAAARQMITKRIEVFDKG